MQVEQKIIEILKQGGVGVLPTDTLYGLVGSVLSKKAVERIYFLKKRARTKPFIILIGRTKDLEMFGTEIDHRTKQVLKKHWPGPISIVLFYPPKPCRRRGEGGHCSIKQFQYLHHGANSLAFRLPKPVWLRNLLKKTGPLAAPSANPEGLEPAQTIEQAKKYFGPVGQEIDFYVSAGRPLKGQPSTLIKIVQDKRIKKIGKIIVLRPGRAKIEHPYV